MESPATATNCFQHAIDQSVGEYDASRAAVIGHLSDRHRAELTLAAIEDHLVLLPPFQVKSAAHSVKKVRGVSNFSHKVHLVYLTQRYFTGPTVERPSGRQLYTGRRPAVVVRVIVRLILQLI